MSRADYGFAVVQVFADERAGQIVQIADADEGGMSVTNDVENVVLEISARLPSPATDYAWIYCDSNGDWDEIVLDNIGNFARFAGLPRGRCFTELQAEALVRYLERRLEATT